MGIWLIRLSHTVAHHSRSTSRPTTRILHPQTPSSIPNSTRRSNQASKRETLHNQRVSQIWDRHHDVYVLACGLICCWLLLIAVMPADARHRHFLLFYRSNSRLFFANSYTGPSGTVKLAKKEAAPKPAAASTKEKKPAAKVHPLA